ncbi:hypothetical protein C1N63_01080 [Pantoea ananatis]|nr:hypothetical protein C1N63_01080 [Pantoea ananatis]
MRLPAAWRAKPSQSVMTGRRSGCKAGSPGSRGRGGWRPLVGRPQGQTETPCRLASETFPESLTESLAKRPTAGTNRYLLRANS